MNYLVLIFALISSVSHALEHSELLIGTPVELTQDLAVNKLLSGAGLQCSVTTHAVWPKVIVGPSAQDVKVRYLMVVGRMTDAITYRVYLQSEQLPCGCVIWIDQGPEFLKGAGTNFRMLTKPKDLNDMANTPAVPTACSNLPGWVAPPKAMDADEEDEVISL